MVCRLNVKNHVSLDGKQSVSVLRCIQNYLPIFQVSRNFVKIFCSYKHSWYIVPAPPSRILDLTLTKLTIRNMRVWIVQQMF